LVVVAMLGGAGVLAACRGDADGAARGARGEGPTAGAPTASAAGAACPAGAVRAVAASPTPTLDPALLDYAEAPQWGGRLGYLDGSGTLKVRMRHDPGAPWVTVANRVKAFQLLDWRLAILQEDGTLRVQEGKLSAPFTVVAHDVVAFQLTLTRVGFLQQDGAFRVQAWGGGTTTTAHDVRAFQVTDDRVGVLHRDGSLWLTDAAGLGELQRVAEDVRTFQLEREYVGYVTGADARLLVAKAEGAERPRVVEQARGVRDFELDVIVRFGQTFTSGLRVAVVTADGRVGLGQHEAGALPVALADLGLEGAGGARVAWAAGALAVSDHDGGLWLTRLAPDGPLAPAQRVAEGARAARLNPEGTLVVDHGHELAVMSFHAEDLRAAALAADVTGPGAAAPGARAALPGGVLPQERLAADARRARDGAATFEISSLRPPHARRPVAAE
jgi:hypothetical protein